MIFTPTTHEEEYINILDNYSHNEFIFIRMTETMHKKSIIDANASLRMFLNDTFDIDYSNIEQGQENKVLKSCNLLTPDGIIEVDISYYRPETKKGDPRFWIYGIKKVVLSDDMFIFTSFDHKPLIIPLKWSFEDFNKLISDLLGSYEIELSDIQKELVSKLIEVYEKGWIKTLRAGDTGVGYTFETLIDIQANSSKEPDFKGIEIKTSRKNGNNNLQTLFSKTPEWGEYKNRGELVIDRGYWDENKNRYALYMTINALVPNSKGWKLKIDYDVEKIYIFQNNDKTVYYDFSILKNALETKHKETLFIKADVKNKTNAKDPNEEFFYNEAFLCVSSSFASFLSLIEKGLVSLDFAIHHDPKTKKTRDHGFLWRMNSQYIPMLFKEHKKIL
jgi:hypothetical protein